VVGAGFLTIPTPIAKPLILTVEIALTVSIAVTLAFLVIGPPSRAARAMTGAGLTAFAMTGAALVGLGLLRALAVRHLLRRVVAFNLMGSGLFLFFGAAAARGGASMRSRRR
jgi:hypothetical protein